MPDVVDSSCKVRRSSFWATASRPVSPDLFEDPRQCYRRCHLLYCGPVLRHSAEPIQAANFRSAVAF